MKFLDYHSNRNNQPRRTYSNGAGNYARPANSAGQRYNRPNNSQDNVEGQFIGSAEAPDNVSLDDEMDHNHNSNYGLRRAIKLWIKVYDVKELNKLLPIAPHDLVAEEFRKAMKEAMKRNTAEGLRRILRLYKAVSSPAEDKGTIRPAAAPYLPSKMGNWPEKTQQKLNRLEEWHKKLLERSQEKTENQYVRRGYERDETVVDVYRRHKIHIVMLSIIPLILILLNLILLPIFATVYPSLVVINLLFFIIAGLWIGWNILDWSNDYLMITNRRVIQVEEVLFFQDEREEITIERVKQVSVEASRNFFEFSFRIGTVTITSAGQGKLVFNRLFMPDRIRKEIDDAKIAYIRGRADFRTQRMENSLRNKFLGEPLKDWEVEPPQVESIPHNELTLWQWLVPSKPVDEGADQLVFRKHPFFLYMGLVKIFISYIILALVATLGLPAAFGLGSPGVSLAVFILCIVWFIVTTVGLWYTWEDWHNDRYILTARNIVDVEKKPFGFDLESNVILLADIQDVSVEKPSLLANFLDYGHVKVTTAGTGKAINFDHVPEPHKIEAEIARRMTKAKHIAEDMNDKLTLDYFGLYQKIFNDTRDNMFGTLINKISDLEAKLDDRRPPQ